MKSIIVSKKAYLVITNLNGYENNLIVEGEDNKKYVIEKTHLPSEEYKEHLEKYLRELPTVEMDGFPKVHGWDFKNDELYVVRDYILGSSISEWAERMCPTYEDERSPLFLDEYAANLLKIIVQLAKIIGNLHQLENPIYHPNLNYLNMTVDKNSQIWLYGLDLVTNFKPDILEVPFDDIMGDHFAAPEIETVATGLTPASDVYTLGLFTIATLNYNYTTYSCARLDWKEENYWNFNDRALMKMPLPLSLFIRQMIDPTPEKRPDMAAVKDVFTQMIRRLPSSKPGEQQYQNLEKALNYLLFDDINTQRVFLK